MILVSALAILIGCALGPMYRVKIDSISDPSAVTKKTYILFPGLKDVEPNDLQFKEYSSYVERALSSDRTFRLAYFYCPMCLSALCNRGELM
jgi:hypothetical protein